MFGAKYSRLTFWIILISLLIPIMFLKIMATLAESKEDSNSVMIIAAGYFIITFIQLNTLANRIRDYGSNPWLSLLALIPLVNIVVSFYYGIVRYKEKPADNKTTTNSDTSFTKAVYNHAKDIAAEAKPAISEYKQKHATSQTQAENQHIDLVDEDAIYEQVMLEIEEDRKVKSTWAKALAQSDGDREKTEALYINLRVQNIIEATQEERLKNSEAEIIKTESTSINTVEKEELKEEEKNQFVFIFFFIIVGVILVFFYTRDTQQSQEIRSSVAPKQDTYEKVAPVVKEEKLLKMVHNKKQGFINEDGDWIIKPIYDGVGDFTEGLSPVQINKKYGFIDKKGNFVIQPIYDNAYSFSEGLAEVKINEKYGFIDKKGNLVIQPVYDMVGVFSEGLARVEINKKWGFIDKKGNLVIQPVYDVVWVFSEGLAMVQFGDYTSGKVGFIDKKGNLVIQPIYDGASSFSDGLAMVRFGDYKSGKYAFIDKKGSLVIQPIYDFAGVFSEGLARVKINEKYGFIDKKGNLVIQPVYDMVRGFSEGLAMVQFGDYKSGKYAFIDKKGNLVIQPVYDEAYPFRDGLAPAVLNGKIFYINKKGEVAVKPKPVL